MPWKFGFKITFFTTIVSSINKIKLKLNKTIIKSIKSKILRILTILWILSAIKLYEAFLHKWRHFFIKHNFMLSWNLVTEVEFLTCSGKQFQILGPRLLTIFLPNDSILILFTKKLFGHISEDTDLVKISLKKGEFNWFNVL